MLKKYLAAFMVLLMVFMIIPASAAINATQPDAVNNTKDVYCVTYVVWGDGFSAETSDFANFTGNCTPLSGGYYDFIYDDGINEFYVAVVEIGIDYSTWTLNNIVDDWALEYTVYNPNGTAVTNEDKVDEIIDGMDIVMFDMMFSDIMNTYNANLITILDSYANGQGKLFISVNAANWDMTGPISSSSPSYFHVRDEVAFTWDESAPVNWTPEQIAADDFLTVFTAQGWSQWAQSSHEAVLDAMVYAWNL